MFSKRSTLALTSVVAVCWYNFVNGRTGYALLWFFLMNRLLMQFPTLIHETRSKLIVPPKLAGSSHLLIAHRGGSWEAPENTLHAFEYALKIGA